MRFEHEIRYDAAPAEVYAMLSDPAFREKVCAAQHAHDSSVNIAVDGNGMSVVVDQKRPSDGVPHFARKIVGDEIHIRQTESWSDPSRAALDVAIPGKPGHLKGSVTIQSGGSGSVETVSGEIKVHLPLVGGKLEHLIGQILESALKAEERVGRAWLAGDR
ncbi:MAG: DUF2505 domain-containing protein [Nocardioidaceae bacterium]